MADGTRKPTLGGDVDMETEGSRPLVKDFHHQDSLFGNSFQSRSFFVVHPEWLSETVDNQDSEPLNRPPWPWEQPRYRQNIQRRQTPEQQPETPDEQAAEGREDPLPDTSFRPMPYSSTDITQPYMYMFTQPSMDITKPKEKHTRFGVPVETDIAAYKLSY